MFVHWDAEDSTTDLHLKAALSLARGLSVRTTRQSKAQAAEFEAITEAILEVEKQTNFLAEVTTSAETIRSGSEKILERIRKSRNSLERQVATLQEKIAAVKQSVETPAAG